MGFRFFSSLSKMEPGGNVIRHKFLFCHRVSESDQVLFLFAFGLEAMPFGEKNEKKKKKEREDRGEPAVGSLPSLIGHKEPSFWSSSSRGKKREMEVIFEAAAVVITS